MLAEQTLDLFEYIQEKVGCTSISDLPSISKQNPEIITSPDSGSVSSLPSDSITWMNGTNHFGSLDAIAETP